MGEVSDAPGGGQGDRGVKGFGHGALRVCFYEVSETFYEVSETYVYEVSETSGAELYVCSVCVALESYGLA